MHVASIEVLIGTILNHLFNDGEIDPVVLAKTGQFAENNYFGKPLRADGSDGMCSRWNNRYRF